MGKIGSGAGLFLCVVTLAACTRLITEDLPTQPLGPGAPGVPQPSNPTPTPATPIPGSTPAPTPTPTIIPTPTPKPTPSGVPTPDPSTTACVPEPPPLSRMNVKVHGDQGHKKVLDSAPIVCSGGEYPGFCEKMMNDPNRRCCPVRPEGHPQRSACETMVVGRARDSGRVGPTWTINGKGCVTGDSTAVPRCVNHPENQYLLYAFGPGRYTACTEGGACGEVLVQ